MPNFLEPFRFIKHARERRDERLRSSQQHQLALFAQATHALEVLVEGHARQAEEQTKGLMAMAQATTAQAEGFSTWIKSFQIAGAPTTSTVTEEDEWRTEQHQLLDAIDRQDIESLPAEFRLAAELQRDFHASVRSDTKA